jgi:hypothetical protein
MLFWPVKLIQSVVISPDAFSMFMIGKFNSANTSMTVCQTGSNGLNDICFIFYSCLSIFFSLTPMASTSQKGGFTPGQPQ